MNRRQPCTSFTSTNQETPERIYRILNNRSPNKKRSGQGDESRQRKRSEAHWSLVNVCSITNLTLNKFFPKNFIIHAPRILQGIPHPTTLNRLRIRRHLDQIPLFHRLSRQNLKWPECEKKFGEKFGENRGQDHCHRSQIAKCFHSTNGRDLRHQHTRRGKTNSPTQAKQAPPPHRTA